MARERTDPRKGAKKQTEEKRPSSHDKSTSKSAQKPKQKGRLGGWGIFLLSVIAICLVINVGLNLINTFDKREPDEPALLPTQTIDPALIEAQAMGILSIPTVEPAATPLSTETQPPSPSPTAAPTEALTPPPTVPPEPEPTLDLMALPTARPDDTKDSGGTLPVLITQRPTRAAMNLELDDPEPFGPPTAAPDVPTSIPVATATARPAMTRIVLPTPATPSPSPSPSPTPVPRYGMSNIDRVNIRKTPDTHADRVALIEREGVGVMILDTTSDAGGDIWFYVGYGRYDGYVLAQYITEIEEDAYWPIATRSSRFTRPPSTARPTATPKPTDSGAILNPGALNSLHRPTLAPQYIGDTKTKVFHLNSCIALPPKADRTDLPSRGIAVTNGYTPCSFCNP